MNIAISAIRTKNIRINRHELVTTLKDLGHNVYYIGQESSDVLHPDYKKYNVKFLSIPIQRTNTNPFKEIISILKTRRVLKNNNIDILIAYGIRTFPTMVTAAKMAGVKKILCIVNGSGRLFQLNGLKGIVVKSISYPMLCLSFSISNKVLIQNSDDFVLLRNKKLLIKKNFDIVNGSGVNLNEFQTSNLPHKPIFSMISRLTESKGVNEYIQAAFKVKEKHPQAKFLLIGPMDDNNNIDRRLLKKAIVENVIIHKGRVDDVRPYIDQARVFVLPSYYPEGIPRSILEAMAMGRAIITTDSPGCKETVQNGRNGFKIPIKNSKVLSEKMIWMIEHPEEVEKMGKESRRIAEEKFNVYKINQKIIDSIL